MSARHSVINALVRFGFAKTTENARQENDMHHSPAFTLSARDVVFLARCMVRSNQVLLS